MIKGTLCYIIAEGRILLIRKKTGFGAGKFNGPGGKIEEDEVPKTAAVREFVEETGVMPLDPVHKGTVAFYYGQREKPVPPAAAPNLSCSRSRMRSMPYSPGER